MTPIRICTPHRITTTRKYLIVARCDGVGVAPRNGSFAGYAPPMSSFSRDAFHHTSAPTPAISPTMLMMLHSTAPEVGLFPTSGSWGQLLVYETSNPGRFVLVAHALHQKNSASFCCFVASTSAPCGIAYSLRPLANTSA